MERYTLNNGIKILVKTNEKTPRCAVVLYAKKSEEDKIPGLTYLMTQLLLQGTKTKNSEELANYFDDNAIEIITENKADYIRVKLLCLNEDLETGLEIMSDIIFNSTFDEYKKEIEKIKGEFEADLDSPKTQAQDEFYRTLYKNHPYGTGRKEIAKKIDSVKKDDLTELYDKFKYKMNKNISFAGDISPEKVKELTEEYLGNLQITEECSTRRKVEPLKSDIISSVKKEDANQAQIFKGWVFPDVYSCDYPVFVLLNTILGSSGLSSRLFLELREKQGLAYTVRSIFEPYMLGGSFTVYIATEPKNIKVSLEGFKKEINKIMTEIITDEELENAKNNAIGKRQFYQETNLLEASLKGYYELLGLGYDFEEKLINAIQSVTKEQILETAKEYFSGNSALCVLAPDKYLRTADLP